MTRRRRWITRIALVACGVAPLSVAGLYVANPQRAHSMDPRERILGAGLYRVPSLSMAPTLQPGRIVIVSAGEAVVRDLHRGDVVVFAPPHRPHDVWVKRLIGLPGDTVELRGGRLRIDGRDVPEPYVDPGNATTDISRDYGPVRVPAGQAFMLGDNRDQSEDSRFWGFASLAQLRERVVRP